MNIATGFISNESIAELRRLIEYRKHTLNLSLFIGMNYIDGFTKLQYDAVKELGEKLIKNDLGNVYVSPKAMFHGKMYSFLKDGECLGAFVGSALLPLARLPFASQRVFGMVCLQLNCATVPLIVTRPMMGTIPSFSLLPFT